MSLLSSGKINIVILMFLFLSGNVCAEHDVNKLKKLFTDKTQRAQIDAARSGNYSGNEFQKANKIKVSGYMIRSDGKNVVWVNGENTLNSSKVAGVKVYPQAINKNKKVLLDIDGRPVQIKPGESWSQSTGKVKDDY